MRSELRRVLLGLLVIIGVILKEGSLVLVGSLPLILDLFTLGWAKLSLRTLKYRQTVSHTRCWQGDELKLTLELENRSFLPVSYLTSQVEVHESFMVQQETLASSRPRRKMLAAGFRLRMWERVRRTYELTCSRRGRYVIGPSEISTTDIFGMHTAYAVHNARTSLLVYPRLYSLDELNVTPKALQGEQSVRRYFLEDPFRLAGTREYREGDPLNRINWKATARAQKHMVQVMEPSSTHDIHYVLNVSTHTKAWQGVDEELAEWTIAVAASLAVKALSQHCRIALTTNEGSADVPLGAGDSQAIALLDALAAAQTSALWSADYVLERVLDARPYGTTLALVTAILDERLASVISVALEQGVPLFVLYTGPQAPPESLTNSCLWIERGSILENGLST